MAQAEWTIMIFLNGDNDLEPFGLTDYSEMAQVGSSDQVNVIVQFDRNGQHAHTSPQWTGGHRFRVEQGVMAQPNVAIEILGDTNMGSGITLRNFVGWTMENYPAKRYMLDIWNHGQGWRFFRAQPPALSGIDLNRYRQFRMRGINREAEARTSFLNSIADGDRPAVAMRVPSIPVNLAVPNTVRYVSSDDTSNDFLYNREMQDSLAGLDLDLIGFDACLMGMVETAYALKSVGKVMVASEELEPGAGWNYADWLAVLVENPEMNASDLGTTLVDSFRRTYENGFEATTLSAVDLTKIEPLAGAIDVFADSLTGLNNAALGQIVDARCACDAYAPGYGMHGIDLANFAAEAATRVGDVSAEASAVESAVDDAVIANYAHASRQAAYGSRGVAIYFPENRVNFQADPDGEGYLKTNTNFPVQFVEERRWADFLMDRYLPAT